MSEPLAVDVVLLPPEEVRRSIIGLISYTPNSVITLNTHTCLPHISLTMGVLRQDSVAAAQALLHQLADEHPAIHVSLTGTETHTIPGNLNIHAITVNKDDQLLHLANDVMSTFKPLFTHDKVTTDMFASPPKVTEASTSWVQNYYQNNKIPGGFRPHITLGEGEATDITTHITFMADRLALYHLGNYCTCRKVLAEVALHMNEQPTV